jgi:carbonic anhydrase
MASLTINESRKRLLDGFRRFHGQIYAKRSEEYRRAVRGGQKPHTLFITCADSRIDPELITQSGPGEIFVARNIGNLVPPYGEVSGSVSAIIEYAVAALKVSQVVVCGHSDCGAMIELLHPDKVNELPVVKSWLRNGDTALTIVRSRHPAGNGNKPRRRAPARRGGADADTRNALEELTEVNVLQQLHHLRTHPSVAGRVADGSLALSGWVYDIADGTVRLYSEEQQKFVGIDG